MSEQRILGGKYSLLAKIATGGMGEIFLAKQKGPVGFEKVVVIKKIRSDFLSKASYVDMFFSEARLCSKLSHGNIVQIFDMGEAEDGYFIAMEYVHGKSLRALMDRAEEQDVEVEPEHIIEVICSLCEGLDYAHRATDLTGNGLNIIHRDINPQNILISYHGDIKIIDFGIAKSKISLVQTQAGTIKGKFVYMSPEQSAAKPLDRRSDLFSAGIVLYELLAGENPFVRDSIVQTLDAIKTFQPPPIGDVDDKLAVFDPIIKKALSKDSNERFSTGREMADALKTVLLKGLVSKATVSLSYLVSTLFKKELEEEQRVIAESIEPISQAEITHKEAKPIVSEIKDAHLFVESHEDKSAIEHQSLNVTQTQQIGVVPTGDHQESRTLLTFKEEKPSNTGYREGFSQLSRASIASIIEWSKKKPRNTAVIAGIGMVLLIVFLLWNKTGNNESTEADTLAANGKIVAEDEKNSKTPTREFNPNEWLNKVTTTEEAPKTPEKKEPDPPAGDNIKEPSPVNLDIPAENEKKEENIPLEPAKEPAVVEEKNEEKNEEKPRKNPAKRSEKTIAKNSAKKPVTPSNGSRSFGEIRIISNLQTTLSIGKSQYTVPKRFALHTQSGSFKIGDNKTPFRVSIQYRVIDSKLVIDVDTEPWAILAHNGIRIGKTPKNSLSDALSKHSLVLTKPDAEPMKIEIDYKNE